MKKFKRFVAFAMAAVLLGTTTAPCATTAEAATIITASGEAEASGSASGDGKVEGYVNTEVFKVVLPTSVDEGTFKFIMDPQRLIEETSGAALDSIAAIEYGTLYFNTASAEASGDWKQTSNAVTVTNKGTVAVDLSVAATISGINGITMASGDTFASGDTTPSLYLALKQKVSGDASGDVAVLTSNGATLEAELGAVSGDCYEFKYSSGDGYSYDLKSGVSGDAFETYSFVLTGGCNSNGNWKDLTGANPEVDLVWTLTKHSDEPDKIHYLSAYTVSSTSIVLNTSLPDGVSISSVVLNKTDGSTATLAANNHYTYSSSANTLSFKAATISANVGATITVTYSDTHEADTIIIN